MDVDLVDAYKARRLALSEPLQRWRRCYYRHASWARTKIWTRSQIRGRRYTGRRRTDGRQALPRQHREPD